MLGKANPDPTLLGANVDPEPEPTPEEKAYSNPTCYPKANPDHSPGIKLGSNPMLKKKLRFGTGY